MIDEGDVLDALRCVASFGIPGRHAALLDVGSSEYVKYFEGEVLDALVQAGGSTCRFLEGAYGSGKTHLIRLMCEAALERGLAVAEAELSRNLSLENWHGITQFVLQKIRVRADGRTVQSLPKILEFIAERGFRADGLSRVPVPHPGFRQGMALYLQPDLLSTQGRRLLKRYLMGERVSVVDLRRLGIRGVKAPLSKRNAEHVMNTVATTLHAFGVPGTLLAFDENEQTLATNNSYRVPRRIHVAANLVRRLVDACPTGRVRGLVAVFAVLPGFVRQCASVYPALGQRLARPTVLKRHSWRSPVVFVSETSSIGSPEEFLEAAVNLFAELAACVDPGTDGLPRLLTEAGDQVLLLHAGEGYRRPLMKALADRTLAHLEA